LDVAGSAEKQISKEEGNYPLTPSSTMLDVNFTASTLIEKGTQIHDRNGGIRLLSKRK
jgi:hypothetical protein